MTEDREPEIKQTPVDLEAVRLLAGMMNPPVEVTNELADPIWMRRVAPALHALDWTKLDAIAAQVDQVQTPAGQRARQLLSYVIEFKNEGDELTMEAQGGLQTPA